MHQKKNKETEASNLIQYFDHGNNIYGLNKTKLKTLIWFVGEKCKEIKRRIAYYEHIHVSHSSFMLAPHLPFITHISDQDLMLVLGRMAPNIRENTIRSDDNHHGKATPEFTDRVSWFNYMLNDNVAKSIILVKTDHMAELGAFNQPLVVFRNYKSNFNSFGMMKVLWGMGKLVALEISKSQTGAQGAECGGRKQKSLTQYILTETNRVHINIFRAPSGVLYLMGCAKVE
ncbi:hypothetical protein Ddye_028897 [Dipteronia dyeriana]|uniref:Uncharacterized protein n=1 Tax=Dipteronia dyeriana TaxID=168575 RepID=A0AAD9TE75_9ROSI|nr:hypothetical protein Ddye_028897 [Dipteronia dyeriana]